MQHTQIYPITRCGHLKRHIGLEMQRRTFCLREILIMQDDVVCFVLAGFLTMHYLCAPSTCSLHQGEKDGSE